MTTEGPTDGALDEALERLTPPRRGDGDVLCVSTRRLAGTDDLLGRRDRRGRNAPADAGRLAPVVDVVDDRPTHGRAGRRLAFHPTLGRSSRRPAETDRLLARLMLNSFRSASTWATGW